MYYVCLYVKCDYDGCRRVTKGGLFPKNTKIVGYARSDLSIEKLKEKCAPYLKVLTVIVYGEYFHRYSILPPSLPT